MTKTMKVTKDGLYRFGKGRKTLWIYVKDGILWLPVKMKNPIICTISGKSVSIVNKRGFMRAKDVINETPNQKAIIERIAAKHGLAI